MKDETIQVGDLVMMVRGHLCQLKKVGGIPFTVERIETPTGGGWYCQDCKTASAGSDEPAANGTVKGKRGRVPLSWLKKINPSAVDETVETSDEVTV